MKRIKKSCWDCRALHEKGSANFACGLGYKIEAVKLHVFVYEPKPMEVCPKPTTWKAWLNTEQKQKAEVKK